MESHGLNQLQASKRNPRKIAPKRLAMLRKAMHEFGDLGGIVRAADGTLIGGHQRVEAFRSDKNAKVHITQRYEKPSRTGTTAEGHVLIDGEKFGYRETNWDGERALAASLSANKAAGDWDLTQLTSIVNDLANAEYDLDLTMFNPDELMAYLPDEGDLASVGEAAPGAHEEQPANPLPAVGTQSAQPANVPVSHVKMVQLFYRDSDHEKFVEMTDALKDIYRQQNLSDTVFEAIKRASISAAT